MHCKSTVRCRTAAVALSQLSTWRGTSPSSPPAGAVHAAHTQPAHMAHRSPLQLAISPCCWLLRRPPSPCLSPLTLAWSRPHSRSSASTTWSPPAGSGAGAHIWQHCRAAAGHVTVSRLTGSACKQPAPAAASRCLFAGGCLANVRMCVSVFAGWTWASGQSSWTGCQHQGC